MGDNTFENRMRELEYFHNLRLLPGAWVVVRVDGRGFSRFTESRFEKPFDLKFHGLMVHTAQALLQEMQGIYAYTESDEISVLFRPDWDFFIKLPFNKCRTLPDRSSDRCPAIKGSSLTTRSPI